MRRRLLQLIVAATIAGFVPGCDTGPKPSSAPWNVDRPWRIAVRVEGGSAPLVFELRDLPDGAAPVVVEELDVAGVAMALPPRFQFDRESSTAGTLTVILRPAPGEAGPRRLLVFLDEVDASRVDAGPAEVRVETGFGYLGDEAIRVVTPSATWIYHTRGAGFAALIDRDGHDWLGYRPGGGPAGEFRGMPNLVHPEGYFHPGGEECETRVVAEGPLRARLDSSCDGGAWHAVWDVFAHHARLTVLRAHGPFWFLYEGAPGGSLEPERDDILRADGSRLPAATSWDDDLPDPEWLAFGDPEVPRVLWLAHLHGDDHPDAYYAMQGEMTVFGFGRRKLDKFLRGTPAEFVVGFIETRDVATIRAAVDTTLAPADTRIGPLEARP